MVALRRTLTQSMTPALEYLAKCRALVDAVRAQTTAIQQAAYLFAATIL